MTETVQVPVDLLKELKSSVVAEANDGWGHYSAEVEGPYLRTLFGLIPAPPKVGDKITGAQFAALPPLSVAIDSEGAVWVSRDGIYATTVAYITSDPAYFQTTTGVYLLTELENGTLMHVGVVAEED